MEDYTDAIRHFQRGDKKFPHFGCFNNNRTAKYAIHSELDIFMYFAIEASIKF